MTIAIGATFEQGIVVCADTKVVASDGATTTDYSKMFLSISRPEEGDGPPRKLFAIAEAAEDARAAKMLASAIAGAALHGSGKIKEVMGEWYRSYGHASVPLTEFILGSVSADSDHPWLRYCQPPSTVADVYPSIAIGRGSRPVDPWLSILEVKSEIKSVLVSLAYLMHLAKRDEGSACGGETHALVITDNGGFTFVGKDEMRKGEELARQASDLFQKCCRNLLRRDSAREIKTEYTELARRASELEFPSLKHLNEWSLWKKPQSTKPSASQRSEREP